jgi:hypothetical protein
MSLDNVYTAHMVIWYSNLSKRGATFDQMKSTSIPRKKEEPWLQRSEKFLVGWMNEFCINTILVEF